MYPCLVSPELSHFSPSLYNINSLDKKKKGKGGGFKVLKLILGKMPQILVHFELNFPSIEDFEPFAYFEFSFPLLGGITLVLYKGVFLLFLYK